MHQIALKGACQALDNREDAELDCLFGNRSPQGWAANRRRMRVLAPVVARQGSGSLTKSREGAGEGLQDLSRAEGRQGRGEQDLAGTVGRQPGR